MTKLLDRFIDNDLDNFIIISDLEKHLSGQHDQATHGRGGNKTPLTIPESGFISRNNLVSSKFPFVGLSDKAQNIASKISNVKTKAPDAESPSNAKEITATYTSEKGNKYTLVMMETTRPEGNAVDGEVSVYNASDLNNGVGFMKYGTLGGYAAMDFTRPLSNIGTIGTRIQGDGVATAMLEFARSQTPIPLLHSNLLSDEGAEFAATTKQLEKHLAGTHDQSTHGRKGGAGFPKSFDAGSYDRSTKFTGSVNNPSGFDKAVGGLTRPDGSPLDPSTVGAAASRAEFRSTPLGPEMGSFDKSFDSLDEQANDFIKRQPVSVFMPEESVDDFLDSETYLTVFNQDPSLKGEEYLDHRTIYEKVAFGYGSDLDPNERPVSGAVLLNGKKAGNDGYLTNQYGSVQLVLKDDVKSRTTYTIGDSLDNFAKPTTIGGKFPRLVNTVNDASSAYRYANNNEGKNIFDSKEWHSRNYLEAQVHGGVKLSDISKVILHYPEGDFDTGRLTELGIPFEVNDGAGE